MPTQAETWSRYCLQAHAPRALAIDAAPQHTAPDLLDFTFALEALRVEAGAMARLMRDADERGAACGATVRAHLPELRLLASHAVALLAEAELEAA